MGFWFCALLLLALISPCAYAQPSSKHFLVKKSKAPHLPPLVELARNLEYDHEIKGLFIPKSWTEDLTADLYIGSTRIQPAPAKIYSIGWKPALFLTCVRFGGSKKDFFQIATKLSRQSGLLIYLNGLTTTDFSDPGKSWSIQDGDISNCDL